MPLYILVQDFFFENHLELDTFYALLHLERDTSYALLHHAVDNVSRRIFILLQRAPRGYKKGTKIIHIYFCIARYIILIIMPFYFI